MGKLKENWPYIVIAAVFVFIGFIAFKIATRPITKEQRIYQEVNKNPIMPTQFLGTVNYTDITKFEPSPGKICYLAQYSSGVSIWCEPDKNK